MIIILLYRPPVVHDLERSIQRRFFALGGNDCPNELLSFRIATTSNYSFGFAQVKMT